MEKKPIDADTATHLTDDVKAVYVMAGEKAIAWIVRNPEDPSVWNGFIPGGLRTLRAHNTRFEDCVILLDRELRETGDRGIITRDLIYSLNED